MRRLYGSDDFFPDDRGSAYHPFQSVNYVTSHDGFTLYDLVSYNQKHNEANGENNRDGMDQNHSWNCGVEGDDNVPAEVLELRRKQIRNFFTLLMLSNGTPMFRAGDEFMQTQRGNNNPYNQDNAIAWLNWNLLKQNGDIFRFFQRMIAFRKAHPSLCRSRFWRDDMRWHGADGAPDLSADSLSVAFFLSGRSQNDDDLYVMINAWWDDLPFVIQEGTATQWHRVVDTALAGPDNFVEDGVALQAATYAVQERSVVVLVRKKAGSL
jgi:glycogen operon protein